MIKVTLFKNAKEYHRELDVKSALEMIKDHPQKQEIQNIRRRKRLKLLTKDEYNKKRESFPMVSWPALQNSSFKIIQPTGLMYFDMDDIHSTVINSVKDKLKESNFVYALWESFSGNGLAFIIKLDRDNISKELYKSTYIEIANEINTKLNGIATVDMKTCDLTRRNFISYDPNIYINENCEICGITDDDKFGKDIAVNKRNEELIKENKTEYEIIREKLLFRTPIIFERYEHYKIEEVEKYIEASVRLNKKIEVGKRGKTYYGITKKLMLLNPDEASEIYIKKEIKRLNTYQTDEPWDNKELEKLFDRFPKIREANPSEKLFKKKVLHRNPASSDFIYLNIESPKSIEQMIIRDYEKVELITKINNSIKFGLKKNMATELSRVSGVSRSFISKEYKFQCKKVPSLLEIGETGKKIIEVNNYINELIEKSLKIN